MDSGGTSGYDESQDEESTAIDMEKVKASLESRDLNLRYKLSQPDFIFEEKCPLETSVDPNAGDQSNSIDSILKEVVGALEGNPGELNFRGPAHAFVPSGAAVSPELKRTEFMAYLQKAGFISALSNIILTLYDLEKLPEDYMAIEYIARMMGYGLTSRLELPASIEHKETLEKEIVKFQRERDLLRRVLDNFESSQTEIELVDPEHLPPLELLEDQGETAPYSRDNPIDTTADGLEHSDELYGLEEQPSDGKQNDNDEGQQFDES